MTGTSDVLRRWPSIVDVTSCRRPLPSASAALLLIQVEAVDHVRLADARPRRRQLHGTARRR